MATSERVGELRWIDRAICIPLIMKLLPLVISLCFVSPSVFGAGFPSLKSAETELRNIISQNRGSGSSGSTYRSSSTSGSSGSTTSDTYSTMVPDPPAPPRPAEIAVEAARSALRTANYGTAIAQLEQALRMEPNNMIALRELDRARAEKAAFERSAEIARREQQALVDVQRRASKFLAQVNRGIPVPSPIDIRAFTDTPVSYSSDTRPQATSGFGSIGFSSSSTVGSRPWVTESRLLGIVNLPPPSTHVSVANTRKDLAALRTQLASLQNALRLLQNVKARNARERDEIHEEMRKVSSDAVKRSFTLGLDIISFGTSRVLDQQMAQMEEALKTLRIRLNAGGLSNDQTKELLKGIGEFEKKQAELSAISDKIGRQQWATESVRALTADHLIPQFAVDDGVALPKMLLNIQTAAGIAISIPEIQKIARVAGPMGQLLTFTPHLVDTYYGVGLQVLGIVRLNEIARYANQDLKSVDGLKRQIEKTVKTMKELENNLPQGE